MTIEDIKTWIENEIESNKDELDNGPSNSHVYSMAWSATETLKRLLDFIGEENAKG